MTRLLCFRDLVAILAFFAPCAAAQPTVIKRRFGWPRLFFIAGLEGTGHHLLCRCLEPRCAENNTSRCFRFTKGSMRLVQPLINTEAKRLYVNAMTFVQELSELKREPAVWHLQCSSKNTGEGFKCSYPDKTFSLGMNSRWEGKVNAHMDLAILAELCEEAHIDLRILVMSRRPTDVVYSTSLKRKFATVEQQTRILLTNFQALTAQLAAIDPRFYCVCDYDDLTRSPRKAATDIARFVGVDETAFADRVASTVIAGDHTHRNETPPAIAFYVRKLWRHYWRIDLPPYANTRCANHNATFPPDSNWDTSRWSPPSA